MNDATPFVSAFAFLWWTPYVLLLVAAVFVLKAGSAFYKALWLWRYRDVPVSDPVIAKALEGVKPPRYWLHCLGWFAMAGIAAFGAFSTALAGQ